MITIPCYSKNHTKLAINPLCGQNWHFLSTNKMVHTVTKLVESVNFTKVRSWLSDKLHAMYKVQRTKFGAPSSLTYSAATICKYSPIQKLLPTPSSWWNILRSTLRPLKMSVTIYQPTRRNLSEDLNIQQQSCATLRFRITYKTWLLTTVTSNHVNTGINIIWFWVQPV
jgi:hypothetical protein